MKSEAGGFIACASVPGRLHGVGWMLAGSSRGTVGACTRRVSKQAGLVFISFFSFFPFFPPSISFS